jgi:hypothetical protein
MAKKEMVKSEQTTEQSLDSSIYSGMSEEEIESILAVTGTESMPEGDRRIPLICWNLEKDKTSGEILEKSKFYNTRSSEQFDEIICSLLYFSRMRDFSETDKSTGVKTVVCRSYDRVYGTRMTGADIEKKFLCETCPYRKSSRMGERKQCVEVMTVAAFDLERKEIFVFRAKRSSHVPFTNYLEKNFFGKVTIKNKKMDLPLYMAVTRMTLQDAEGSNNSVYYEPKFQMVKLHNDKDMILELRDMSERVRSMDLGTIADSSEHKEDEFVTENGASF